MLKQIRILNPKKKSLNGTMLYGDVQELYTVEKEKYTIIGNYVHAVYQPLNNEEIAELKNELPFLADDYLSFLSKYNGLNLFSDSLCLYGFGRILSNGKYIASRDPNIVLPYRLGDYNKVTNGGYIIGTFCECKIKNDISNNCYILLYKSRDIILRTNDGGIILVEKGNSVLDKNYDVWVRKVKTRNNNWIEDRVRKHPEEEYWNSSKVDIKYDSLKPEKHATYMRRKKPINRK
jgi:hypothetical protein